MITDEQKVEFYQALLDKKTQYEGIFFVGVKTTGVFCRPTCPALKPKFENCEFFENAKQALLASFRPCKRCRPLSHPNHVSKLVQILVEAVEKNPEKRWKDKDFKEICVDESTARRQFKKRFGMTFIEYARARRMGLAMKQIRNGDAIIEAQLSTGYESGSGFRDAFRRIMGVPPSKIGNDKVLRAAESMQSLRKEQDKLQQRIGKMYDDKLDGLIDEKLYLEKVKAYKSRQLEILEEMKRHEVADEHYYITIISRLTQF